ncbi:MAG: hypothetical protein AB7T63_10320 [Planctomycetota bacterium]
MADSPRPIHEYGNYIVLNYPGVLTSAESMAVRVLHVRFKTRSGDAEARLARMRESGTVRDDDPEVAALLADGETAFYDRLVQRVRTECADEVFFNCCAECEGLTATPLARQCLHCGHDWH